MLWSDLSTPMNAKIKRKHNSFHHLIDIFSRNYVRETNYITYFVTLKINSSEIDSK